MTDNNNSIPLHPDALPPPGTYPNAKDAPRLMEKYLDESREEAKKGGEK